MWMGECLFHNKFQQQLTISQLQSTQTYSLYSQGLYNVCKHTNSPPNMSIGDLIPSHDQTFVITMLTFLYSSHKNPYR
jgi:hypothetical protein